MWLIGCLKFISDSALALVQQKKKQQQQTDMCETSIAIVFIYQLASSPFLVQVQGLAPSRVESPLVASEHHSRRYRQRPSAPNQWSSGPWDRRVRLARLQRTERIQNKPAEHKTLWTLTCPRLSTCSRYRHSDCTSLLHLQIGNFTCYNRFIVEKGLFSGVFCRPVRNCLVFGCYVNLVRIVAFLEKNTVVSLSHVPFPSMQVFRFMCVSQSLGNW